MVNPTGSVRRQDVALRFNWRQARAFITLIADKSDAQVTFQTFSDDPSLKVTREIGPKPGRESYSRKIVVDPLAKTFGGTLADHQDTIEEANRSGAYVGVTISQTRLGRRTLSDLIGFRAVWAELDEGMPDREWPLEPSLIIESSPRRYHVYWLCGDDKMTDVQFRGIGARLVSEWKSDHRAMDPVRVLRLPGTYNMKVHKYGKPFLVQFISPTLETLLKGKDVPTYTTNELIKAFPPIEPARRGSSSAVGQAPAAMDDVVSALNFLVNQDTGRTNADGEVLTFVNDYDMWWQFGLALYREFGNAGFDIWDEWSKQGREAYDEGATAYKWSSFDTASKREGGVTVGTIFHHAKRFGWTRPQKELTLVAANDPAPTVSKGFFGWPALKGSTPDKHAAANVLAFLKYKGWELWHNQFDNSYYIEGYEGGSRLTDAILRNIRLQMHGHQCRVGIELFTETVKWVAENSPRHPVREYLDGLHWDGEPRVDSWLIDFARASDTPYVRAVGRAFLISAVRRVRAPGCPLYGILVLQGEQGAGKSSFLQILASPEWFSDCLPLGASPKEVLEQSSGAWIIEAPELAGMQKREVEAVKAMITRRSDKARAAYGHLAENIARQFVIAATTNSAQYLRDKTGNRRFWSVEVGSIRLKAIARARDQLWAEAAMFEASGESHNIPKDLWEAAAAEQEREVSDPIEQKLISVVESAPEGFVPTDELFKAIGLEDISRRHQGHNHMIAAVMKKFGWTHDRRRRGSTGPRAYGYVAHPTPDKAPWLRFHSHSGELVLNEDD